MSMRLRQKKHADIYPNWKKKNSPARRAKIRDGLRCVTCGVAEKTLVLDELGQPDHIIYLHAAHLCPLDPQYDQVEPIEGQRLRAMCPSCHGAYDAYWRPRWDEVEHQRNLHGILLARWLPSSWLSKRFLEVR